MTTSFAKAALDKSLVWSNIDQNLWLANFTVNPSVLQEEYPLFQMDPKPMSLQGALEAHVTSSIASGHAIEIHAISNTFATNVGGPLRAGM